MSQNRSRRRGPHQSRQPRACSETTGTRTELRRRRCVRRLDSPGHRPAGERNPTPGVHRWTAPRRARGLSGTLGDWDREPGEGPGLSRAAKSAFLSRCPKALYAQLSRARSAGRTHLCERASAQARVPLPLCPLSLCPLRLCASSPSSCSPLISLSHLLRKGTSFVPALVPDPTGSRGPIHLGRHFRGPGLSRGREVPTNWLPSRLARTDWESWAVCLWSSVCLPVVPRHLIAKSSSPSSRSGAGGLRENWLLTPLRVGARGGREVPGRARGSCNQQLPRPRLSTPNGAPLPG